MHELRVDGPILPSVLAKMTHALAVAQATQAKSLASKSSSAALAADEPILSCHVHTEESTSCWNTFTASDDSSANGSPVEAKALIQSIDAYFDIEAEPSQAVRYTLRTAQ